MAANVAERLWQLAEGTELHWRRLDDEWVVFDVSSGDTHHLDLISAAVLMCLEAGPLDLDGLVAAIASELRLPSRADLTTRVKTLLEQLSRLGVVEPVEP